MPLHENNLFHIDIYAEMFVEALRQDSEHETLAYFLQIASFCHSAMHDRHYLLQAENTPACCAELKALLLNPHLFRILQLQPGEFNHFRLHLIIQVIKHVIEKLPMLELLDEAYLEQFRQLTRLSSQTVLSSLQEYQRNAAHNRLPSRPVSRAMTLFATAAIGSLTGLLGFWLREIVKTVNTRLPDPQDSSMPHDPWLIALAALFVSFIMVRSYQLVTTPSRPNAARQ